MGSAQPAEAQGSQSELVRVEVTVHQAGNVPHIKTILGVKREYFVTITYQVTKKKTKKTKSVQIEGQTAVWNQSFDAFFVQPFSHLTLCLYAKRLTQSDLLIGTHEITIPVESESDISFVLSHGNGQAGQSAQPVTLHLAITVSSDSPKIPAQRNDSPAGEVPKPTMVADSRGPDQSTTPEPAPEPPSPTPDPPVQSSTLLK